MDSTWPKLNSSFPILPPNLLWFSVLAFNLSPIRHPATRDTNLNVISGDAALPHPPPSLILHHSSLSLIDPPQDDCSCLQKMKLSGTSLFFLSRVSIFIFHLCLLQSPLSGLFTLPSQAGDLEWDLLVCIPFFPTFLTSICVSSACYVSMPQAPSCFRQVFSWLSHAVRFDIMFHLMPMLLVTCPFLPPWFSAVGFFGSGSFPEPFTRPTFYTTLASKTEKETPWLC